MTRQWNAADVLEMVGGYQQACVLAAAAELDVFSRLRARPART